MQEKTVVVVTSDKDLLDTAVLGLNGTGYRAVGLKDGNEALAQIEQSGTDAVLADLSSPAVRNSGLLSHLRANPSIVLIAMLPEFGAIESNGSEPHDTVYDYVAKPLGVTGLVRSVNRALEHRDLIAEIVRLKAELADATNASKEAFQIPTLPDSGISLQNIERELLTKALEKFRGNQTRTARYLNISRRTLIYRIGKYKLKEVATLRASAAN